MFRSLQIDNNIMPDVDQKGRRHFNAGLKKTSLYGCENGDVDVNKSAEFSKNFTKNKKDDFPQKYGSWWSPTKKEVKETDSQNQFFGRMRESPSTDKKRLTGIAGFSLGAEDETESPTECIDANNNGAVSENSLQQRASNERINGIEDFNNHTKSIEQDRSSDDKAESFDYESDLIRRAAERALERQKQTKRETTFEHGIREEDRLSKHVDQLDRSHELGEQLKVEPRMVQSVDKKHLSQKQLLEQHMSGRSSASYIYRPPWHTSYDEKDNGASRRLRKPVQHEERDQKQVKQRTCNQIDFPAYTAQEISAARKNIFVSNRNEKCTWLPNLAADFDIERRKRISSSNLNVDGGLKSRIAMTKQIVDNSLADRDYNSKARVTAPYASYE